MHCQSYCRWYTSELFLTFVQFMFVAQFTWFYVSPACGNPAPLAHSRGEKKYLNLLLSSVHLSYVKVMHRDLKLANMLISASGVLKVGRTFAHKFILCSDAGSCSSFLKNVSGRVPHAFELHQVLGFVCRRKCALTNSCV